MNGNGLTRWLPWTDRAGRVSWLKAAVFIGCLAPAGAMVVEIVLRELSPQPVMDLIRQSGDWTIRLLVLTLAVTPLRALTRWNRLIGVRRMLGLSTLAYALLHVSLYCLDEKFVWWTIASEIALRIYLTIGFVALLGLIALGATSSDAAVRRLGSRRWAALHRLVYGVALLGLIHYFIQLRLDASQAAMMAGFAVLLMGVRLLRRGRRDPGAPQLSGLAIAAGLATAALEAGYYRIATGVDALRVLQANLDFSYSIRPAWWVFAAGLLLALLSAGTSLRGRAEMRGRLRTRAAQS
jgi:sulfoxide reductase heme-binding subunit YedZ